MTFTCCPSQASLNQPKAADPSVQAQPRPTNLPSQTPKTVKAIKTCCMPLRFWGCLLPKITAVVDMIWIHSTWSFFWKYFHPWSVSHLHFVLRKERQSLFFNKDRSSNTPLLPHPQLFWERLRQIPGPPPTSSHVNYRNDQDILIP